MKLLIGTPAYGGQVTTAYMNAVIATIVAAANRGDQVDVMTTSNESLITRARNDVTATFMEGDWDALLFIDADIEFTPQHVFRLWDSPYEVVATPYPMKGINWDAMSQEGGSPDRLKELSRLTVVNTLADSVEDGNGFSTVAEVGTGFLLIRRSAMLKLIEAHPETLYTREMGQVHRYAIFDCEIRDGRYLSEDYLFCHRWRDLGEDVWCDVASPTLYHHGAHRFGG